MAIAQEGQWATRSEYVQMNTTIIALRTNEIKTQ